MKKILLLLITLFIVCTSCGNSNTEEPVSMDELMKISTWLLDDELEGTGRWGYISFEEKHFRVKQTVTATGFRTTEKLRLPTKTCLNLKLWNSGFRG